VKDDDDDDDDETEEEEDEDDESVEGGCSSGCCLAEGGCNAEELRLRDQDLLEEEDTDGQSSKVVSDPATRVTDADYDEAVSDSAGASRAICSEDTLPAADSIEKTQPVSQDKLLNPSQPDRVEELVIATTKDDQAMDSNQVAKDGGGF
jgi:hypothetical protein